MKRKLKRHTVQTRQITREIQRLKRRQLLYRKRWLDLDIKILALSRKIEEILGGMKK